MAADRCGTFTLTSAGVRGVRVNGAAGSTALRDECWK
jgi:type IV pilus assembly protein PilE